jgi:hypothetical protein
MAHRIPSRAEADLRRILAMAHVPPRCFADTPRGIALAPAIARRILARLDRYRRPFALLDAIEAAERRWLRLHSRPASA